MRKKLSRVGARPKDEETDTRTDSEKAADRNISRDQRSGLAILLHYYLLSSKTRSEDIEEMRRVRGSFIESDFRNVHSKASDKGAEVIHRYYRKHFTSRDFLGRVPDYVQRAVAAAYGPDSVPMPYQSLLNTYRQIADSDSRHLENISRRYHGCWSIFRFAGHSRVPKIMWAAMQIKENQPEDFPTFEIAYRPENLDQKNVTGAIISIENGDWMSFVGCDDSKHPLDILAKQESSKAVSTTFTGMVKRVHETRTLMSARILCIRSTTKTFEEMKDLVNAYREDALRKQLPSVHPGLDFDKNIVPAINNKVLKDGRSVLFL